MVHWKWWIPAPNLTLRELSQQVGSVFSPQKTVSLPLRCRPIILAVERTWLPLFLSHKTAWNLLLSLFWHQFGVFIYFRTVFHFLCCHNLQ